MSLASSPDCFLRAGDKVSRMFYPSTDQPPNNFDDFFDRELYPSSEDDPIKPEPSEDSIDFFAPVPANNEYASYHESSPQPWRKGLWSLNERPGSQLVVGKTRKKHSTPPPNISPAHLIVNEDLACRSSRSTTHSFDTKNSSPSRVRQMHCLDTAAKQRPPRDMNLSPSPMYSKSFADDKNGFVDAWQQDFDNFNLRLNDDYSDKVALPHEHLAENPNQSLKYSRRAQTADRAVKMEQRSATMHHFSPAKPRHIPHHATHELTTILNANLNATGHNMYASQPDKMDMTFRFVNEDLPCLTDCTTGSLHSSDSSLNSQFSHNSRGSQQAAMYNTATHQNWWSPPHAHGQVHSHEQYPHPSSDHYPGLVQPKPRRVTHHTLDQDVDQDDCSGNGYPCPEGIGLAVPYYPPELPVSSMPVQYNKYINSLASYPPLPPPVHHTFPDESPFRTPRRARAPTRTPSPSISPTRQSRSQKQRSPSRRDPSQHRRKSIHKAGPIKGAETPRNRSTSRPPRTPKTPKMPHDSFGGQMGFVNFTPKDASKLLNDVAPSGSSKTRARREQEAREQRKKLSEAALSAVRDAGGDVEALERAIYI